MEAVRTENGCESTSRKSVGGANVETAKAKIWIKFFSFLSAIVTVLGIGIKCYFDYQELLKEQDTQIKNKELDIENYKIMYEREIEELKIKYDYATIDSLKKERDKTIAERNILFGEKQDLTKQIMTQDVGKQKALQEKEDQLQAEYANKLKQKEEEIAKMGRNFEYKEQKLQAEFEQNLKKAQKIVDKLETKNKNLTQSLLEQAMWDDLIQIRRNPYWVIRVLVIVIVTILGSFVIYTLIYCCVRTFYFFREYFIRIHIDDDTNKKTIDNKTVYTLPLLPGKIKKGGNVKFYFRGQKECIPMNSGLSLGELYSLKIQEKEISIKLAVRKRAIPVMNITFPFKITTIERA